jgi:hypothetical protein
MILAFFIRPPIIILERKTEPIRPEYDRQEYPDKNQQEDCPTAAAHARAAAIAKPALEPAINFIQKEQFEQS